MLNFRSKVFLEQGLQKLLQWRQAARAKPMALIQ